MRADAFAPVGELQTLICAFLEEGPQPVDDLAAIAGVKVGTITAACEALAEAGLARQVRPGIWAEVGYQVPAPTPRKPNMGRRPKNSTGGSCTRCRARWAQEHGLCRRCGRETGTYTQTGRERDRAIVATRQAAIPLAPPPVTTAQGTRIIDGVEFEVVFTGREALLPPREHPSSLTCAAFNAPTPRVGRTARAAH